MVIHSNKVQKVQKRFLHFHIGTHTTFHLCLGIASPCLLKVVWDSEIPTAIQWALALYLHSTFPKCSTSVSVHCTQYETHFTHTRPCVWSAVMRKVNPTAHWWPKHKAPMSSVYQRPGKVMPSLPILGRGPTHVLPRRPHLSPSFIKLVGFQLQLVDRSSGLPAADAQASGLAPCWGWLVAWGSA